MIPGCYVYEDPDACFFVGRPPRLVETRPGVTACSAVLLTMLSMGLLDSFPLRLLPWRPAPGVLQAILES